MKHITSDLNKFYISFSERIQDYHNQDHSVFQFNTTTGVLVLDLKYVQNVFKMIRITKIWSINTYNRLLASPFFL